MLTRREVLAIGLTGLALGRRKLWADEEKERERVLILGAGVSGLAAGRLLSKQGFNVQILEGQQRIGGRIKTDRSLGTPIDLGASFIHGVKGNPITALAHEFGITTRATNEISGTIFDDNGKPIPPSEILKSQRIFNQLADQGKELTLERSKTDRSLRDAIHDAMSPKDLAQWNSTLRVWQEALAETELGADASELSMRLWDDAEEFDGADHVFPAGYDSIVHGLAKGIDIRLGERVKEIRMTSSRVEVATQNKTYDADRVIVTFSLGVLQKGDVRFVPPMPESKRESLSRLKMGVLNKIVMKFKEPFWPAEKHFFGLATETGTTLPILLNMAPFNQSAILIAFLGGSRARSIESKDVHDVQSNVIGSLKKMFGQDLPKPTGWVSTQWSSDEFSFGSYSFTPVGAKQTDPDILAEPMGNRIFFAGEATNKSYPATVHGAYLSGIREANRIVQLSK